MRETLLAEADRLFNKAAKKERFKKGSGKGTAVRQKVPATVSSSGPTDEDLNEMRMVIRKHYPLFPGIEIWFSLWDNQKIPSKRAYYQHLAYVIQFNNLGNVSL